MSNTTRRSFLSIPAALALALARPFLTTRSASAGPARSARAPDFSQLLAQVDDWVASGVYPGAALLIGMGDEVLLERYFGGYSPDTAVHVASAGKWLAAATIASVVDREQLRWDDPVSKWLPEMQGPKGRATLRQLLSHTSGYPDYQPEDRPRDDYQTLGESVAQIVPLPADSEPGTHFRYGGLAMQVAGRMAEVATLMHWEELFQVRIAGPLGMKNTAFTPVSAEPGFSPMLGGGARTTLRDYARFLRMIDRGGSFEGKRVLSSAAIAEMQCDQVRTALIAPEHFVDQARADTRTSVYGLGEWREELDAQGRPTLLSSPGWAGAYPWIDKTTNSYGFLLAKVDVAQAKELGFSSFLSSPVLPMLARDAFADAKALHVERGHALVTGGNLYWEATGQGPPMILLHGHSFDRTMWDPQVNALKKHFRIVRYDMRGYGRSSMPSEKQSVLHAEDLRALMDALSISRAHLVGLSLGGAVAVDMLALYPGRLLSVTAASGDIFDFYPGPDEPWTEEMLDRRRNEIAALRQEGIYRFKRGWLDQLTARGGSCIRAIRPKLWTMIYKWSAWQPLHIEPRLLLGRSVTDMLRSNRPQVPLQIVTGEADLGLHNLLLEILPATPRVVIPNAGHVSNLETPRAFTEAILNFTAARSGNRKRAP